MPGCATYTSGPVRGAAGAVDLRAEERGRRRLRDRLEAAFECEPLEDGMDHPAEEVITAALDSEDPDVVLRWIRNICLDPTRPMFAAGVFSVGCPSTGSRHRRVARGMVRNRRGKSTGRPSLSASRP